MKEPFAAAYPVIARWVREQGWVEIGSDGFRASVVRALDEGGMIWEGASSYPTLDAALRDLEAGIAAWLEENG